MKTLEEFKNASIEDLDGKMFFDVPDEVYHSPDFPGLSNSMCGHLKKSYEHLEQALSDARERAEEQEDGMIRNLNNYGTAAKNLGPLQFGTMLHDYILLPDVFREKFATFEPPICPIKGRKKEDKERQDEWKKTVLNEYMEGFIGKTAVNYDDMDKVLCMAKSVGCHPVLSALLDHPDTKREVTFFKTYRGVLRKCRADIFNDSFSPDFTFVGDLKTTQDASIQGFSKSIVAWDYDRQAAYYSDIISDVTNKPVNFCLIPIEKNPPYGVTIFSTDHIVETGREIYKHLLDYYVECQNEDKHKGYTQEIVEAHLPAYGYDVESRKRG